MVKYLISMPDKLKKALTKMAKEKGFTLNGYLLEIFWNHIKQQEEKVS